MPVITALLFSLQAPAPPAPPRTRPCTITLDGQLAWKGLPKGDDPPRFISRTESFHFSIPCDLTWFVDPKGPVSFHATRANLAGPQPTGSYTCTTMLPGAPDQKLTVRLDRLKYPFISFWLKAPYRKYPLIPSGSIHFAVPTPPTNAAEQLLSAAPFAVVFPAIVDALGNPAGPEFKFQGPSIWLLEGNTPVPSFAGEVVFQAARTSEAMVTGYVRVHFALK